MRFAPALLCVGAFAASVFDAGKPTALVFLRTDCPISNRYAPEVSSIAHDYSPRIAFYVVYSDATETDAAIRQHMAAYALTAPMLRDTDRSLAARSKVTVTPEAALFDAQGRLVYHGRIDDRQVSLSVARPQPAHHDLRSAIEALLAGRPVTPAGTKAIGCALADLR